ncbi:hypothetical protein PhCBS80983_g02319 [Powellomyces hirtus]|uniref:Nucleoporin Nup54 alpha-helical domain-containing protein n=1 Tax=Powellomyces hirtus TaxID=109895 RepID=A0A507E995_9FUNG|nr:hypothetical protein PhCBS80983_g02319 [Powellomyces hirtus]
MFGAGAAKPGGFSFGAPAATPGAPAGGGFGTQPPAAGGGLFGGAATSAPAAGGGLFGGAAAPTATPSFGGFGGAGATSAAPAAGGAQPAPAGGLFGGASKPAATPSLFGQPAASAGGQPSLFGASAPGATSTAPSLFGASATSAPGAAPSLFGGPAASAPSLFGGAPASSAPGGSLFGTAAAASSAPGASLFASAAPAASSAAPSLFGTAAKPAAPGMPAAGFGGASPAQGNQQPAAQGPVTLRTKYSEIPADTRKHVDDIETFIQQQIRTAESIAGNTTADSIYEITGEVKQLSHKLAGLNNMLARDKYLIDLLRQQVGQELRNSDLVSRFIERYRSGSHHTSAPPKHDAYMSYFVKYADNVEQRMQQYRQTIEELEASIKSLSEERQYSPMVLVEIMRDQDDSLLAVAGKIANVHDAVAKLKSQYADFRQRYFGVDDKDRFRREGRNGRSKERTPLELIASTTLRPSSTQPAQGGMGGFGQQAPAGGLGGSLFGGSQAFGQSAQPAAAGGSLFGQSAQPAATGSLFGQSNHPAAGGSLFGQPAQPAAGASLFGQTAQPGAGASLFGQQSQPAAPGASLFGQRSQPPTSLFENPIATPKKKALSILTK